MNTGFRDTAVVVIAAFFMALLATGFTAPQDECSEHQLVPDAAINDAFLALAGNDHFTDGYAFDRWSWRPFVFVVSSWRSSIGNAFQPFTRYCKEGDAMIDAEIEFTWVASAECYVGHIEALFAVAHVTFSQAVAKVRFQLSRSTGNESLGTNHWELHPVAVRVTWPGTASARVYNTAPGYYEGPVNVLASLVVKLYANDILNWNWTRSAIKKFFVDVANGIGHFHLET